MAQRVQAIYDETTLPIPASYTLPPGLDMEFESSVARINGAAASGTFIAVLDAVTQDGKVMAQARIDQEFAAGDTGVVAWGPFLKRAATSTPPPSGSVVSFARAVKLPMAVNGPTDVDYGSFSTTYDQAGYFETTAGGDLQINAGGIYELSFYNVITVVSAGVTTKLLVDINVVSGSAGSWSSKASGADELYAGQVNRIVDAATALNVTLLDPGPVVALVAWSMADTFPVVIRVTLDAQQDNASVSKNVDAVATFTRLGAPDE